MGTRPEWVEIDGAIYTLDEDQAHRRVWLDRHRRRDRVRVLGGREALKLLEDEWWAGVVEVKETVTLALKTAGKSLVRERPLDVWKLLYLELRHENDAEISDRIAGVVQHDDYREGDELYFLFGDAWESYLASTEEADRAAAHGDGEAASA